MLQLAILLCGLSLHSDHHEAALHGLNEYRKCIFLARSKASDLCASHRFGEEMIKR